MPPFREQRNEACAENHDRQPDIPGPRERRMRHHWFRLGAIAGGSVAAGVHQSTEAKHGRGGDWEKDGPAISNGGHARSTPSLADGVPDSARPVLGFNYALNWLDHYNQHRPHSSLGNRPPISRVHNVRGVGHLDNRHRHRTRAISALSAATLELALEHSAMGGAGFEPA
jgi:hypothetical protein